MKKKLWLIVLGLLVLALSIMIFFAFNAQQIHAAQQWRGIFPGKSTEPDITAKLGLPDKVEERKGYIVYLYEKTEPLEWKEVEIWFEKGDEQNIVRGIFLIFPVNDQPPAYNLDMLLDNHGTPNMITWTISNHYRFLGWTKWGVATEVSITRSYIPPEMVNSETRIATVLFFEPMSRSRFFHTKWPWPGFVALSTSNSHTEKVTDSPDTFPLNPFGWWIVP